MRIDQREPGTEKKRVPDAELGSASPGRTRTTIPRPPAAAVTPGRKRACALPCRRRPCKRLARSGDWGGSLIHFLYDFFIHYTSPVLPAHRGRKYGFNSD
jgi:hypothetical protein